VAIDRRRLGRSVLVCVAAAAWVLGPALPGSAAPAGGTAQARDAAPAFSLNVSPTRLALPPDQLNRIQRFRVSNQGRLPMDVVVEKSAFTPAADGSLLFQRAPAPYSAVNWISVSPAHLRLAPGTAGFVSVRISVPAAPEPGDHQVALLFMVPAGNAGNNIRLNRGIGTPIYITVPGPTVNTTTVGGLRVSGFAISGPITFHATVRDAGTVHRDFRGPGRLTVAVGGSRVGFPDFTVLRNSSRDVTVSWRHPPWMCVCHARIAIADAGGVRSTVAATIVIVPVRQLAIGLAAVVAGVLAAVVVRRRYRTQVQAAAERLRGFEHRGAGPEAATERGPDVNPR
jgi:hypothetical protein